MIGAKKKLILTEGPIFTRMLAFAFPVILTGLLQILYNMADNIVVGKFSGDPLALGAVASTSSLNTFMLTFVLGISAGSGVVVSQAFGAKNDSLVSKTVHTAILSALVLGVLFGGIGLLISEPALRLIGTNEVLIEKATLYFRIICLGIPATVVTNFGAAILRSIGDSKTPLIILSSSGLINVVLNLVFVLFCGMTVDGVAYATIISQYVSAAAVLIYLRTKKNESYCFSFRRLCFDRGVAARILRLGIPSGIQSSLFSFANVVLTNGLNTFPPATITAYGITCNIDAITYTSCSAFYQTTLTFVGQNRGANKIERIKKILIYGLIQVIAIGIIVSQIELLLSDQLVSLYMDSANPDLAVISEANNMLLLLLNTYFLCGVMEVFVGALRGIGYSIAPMLISLCGACIFRIIWRFFVFPLEAFNSSTGLLLCFPLSWILTILMQGTLFIFAWKKLKKLRARADAAKAAKEKNSEEATVQA